MNKVVRLALVAAMGFVARPALGQGGSVDTQCRGGTAVERITQDACQKSIDLFTLLAPQLGGGIAGGNAISGEHSVIGRPGHASLGVRINAVRAQIPKVDARVPVLTGATASDYEVAEHYVPIPTIDAAFGVFRGVPIGGVMALGVDALLNLSILPTLTTGDIKVTLPGGPAKLGIGARVSLVAEDVVTPGISFTYLKRDLPQVTVVATPATDELRVDDFQVKTSAWRGTIGKSLGVFAITAGFGQDKYETGAVATVTVTRNGVATKAGPIVATQVLTRDNAFGSIALRLPVVSISAEFGRASGGSLKTFNTFGTARADDPLTYVSVGVRVRY